MTEDQKRTEQKSLNYKPRLFSVKEANEMSSALNNDNPPPTAGAKKNASRSNMEIIRESVKSLQDFDLNLDDKDDALPLADAIDDIIIILSEALFAIASELKELKEAKRER